MHRLDVIFPQANDTLGKVLKGKPLIDPGDVDGLLEGRYAFINLWRSFSNNPVQVRISIDPSASECLSFIFNKPALAPRPHVMHMLAHRRRKRLSTVGISSKPAPAPRPHVTICRCPTRLLTRPLDHLVCMCMCMCMCMCISVSVSVSVSVCLCGFPLCRTSHWQFAMDPAAPQRTWSFLRCGTRIVRGKITLPLTPPRTSGTISRT